MYAPLPLGHLSLNFLKLVAGVVSAFGLLEYVGTCTVYKTETGKCVSAPASLPAA